MWRHENHHFPPHHARRRLQPGAVARRHLGRGCPADAGGARQCRHPARLRLGLAPARRRHVHLRVAGHGDRQALGGRRLGLPGDGDRLAAGLAGPEVPGRADGRARTGFGASTATGTRSAPTRPISGGSRSGWRRSWPSGTASIRPWPSGTSATSTAGRATATCAPRRSASGSRRATAAWRKSTDAGTRRSGATPTRTGRRSRRRPATASARCRRCSSTMTGSSPTAS